MEVKRRKWFKTLAAFFAFIMFLTSVQITAFASLDKDISEEEIQKTISDSISEKEYSDAIVTEITGERDEYTKTFLMDDGSYYSIVSNDSIHTFSDNEWIDIYNELDTSYETVSDVEDAVAKVDVVENTPSNLKTNSDFAFEDNNVLCAATDSIEQNGIFDIDMLDLTYSYLFIKPDFVDTYSSENKVVTKATCNFSISSVYDETDLSIYEETYDWENSIDTNGKVNYQNDSENLLIDKEIIKEDESVDLSIDVTNSFIKWERNILDNNGICIKIHSSVGEVYISNISFSISYINADSDNTNYTYHTLDLGKAGTVSINDITNTFSVSQNIIGIDSFVMPVNITRTISSVSPNLESTGNVGGNWNYGKSITYYGNVMVWKTPDGSNVRFVETDKIEDGYVIWEQITDNVAAYATLYVKNNTNLEVDNTDYSNCYIKDSDYTYKFNSSGKLSSIFNGTYSVSLNYGEYGLMSILDTNGNTFKFTYGTYKIKTTTYRYVKNISVYDSNNKRIPSLSVDITASYNSSSNKITLTTTFSDNSSISYVFDNCGFLEKIICEDGSVVDFTYANPDNPYITGYEHKLDETILESLCINSNYTYYRIFTDENDNSEYYYYNTKYQLTTYEDTASKNVTCISYDDNGSICSYATLEKESILKNHDFSANPAIDKNWDITNKSFYHYDEKNHPHLSLSPSESNVKFTQTYSDSADKILKQGAEIVFGIKGYLNNTYPISNEEHNIGVVIKLTYSDRTTESYSLEFDTTLLDTNQTLLKAVELNKDCRNISYSISVKNQEGSLWVDDAILFVSDGSEDPFGIETSKIYNTEYDENGRLIKESISNNDENPLSLIQTYQYNDENNMTSITDYDGLTKYYKYDASTNKLLQCGSMVDSAGNITDPTTYAYNAVGLLESIESVVSDISDWSNDNSSAKKLNTIYSYDESNRITSVNNNGLKYNFAYDASGNITRISVIDKSDNETVIQSNEYSDNNINGIVYSNGSYIKYDYDNITGKITNVQYYDKINDDGSFGNKLLSFEYVYSDDNISSVICAYTDNVKINVEDVSIEEDVSQDEIDEAVNEYSRTLNLKTKIVYTDGGYEIYDKLSEDNSDGRLLYSSKADGKVKRESRFNAYVGTENPGFTENSTTEYNSVKSDNTTRNTTSYNIEKHLLGSEDHFVSYKLELTSEKDYFGRNKSKISQFYFKDNKDVDLAYEFKTDYTYKSLDDNQTTSLISSTRTIVEDIHSGDADILIPEMQYIYDSRGNLQFEYQLDDDSGSEEHYALTKYYGYDELNQLISEIDLNLGIYRSYSYDNMGNMISKIQYDNVEDFIISNHTVEETEEILGPLSYIPKEDFIDYDFSELSNEIIIMNSETYYECIYDYDEEYPDRLVKYTEKYNNVAEDYTEIVISETINYDDNGNPLDYIGYNYDGLVRAKLSWTGNQLTEFAVLDEDNLKSEIYRYSYDQNGYRTLKNKYILGENGYILVNSAHYIWDNGKLQEIIFEGQTVLYSESNEEIDDNCVSYSKIMYDSDGEPTAYVTPSGAFYYYVKDKQGNVTKLLSSDLETTFSYEYDSWGQLVLPDLPSFVPNPQTFKEMMQNLNRAIHLSTVLYNPCTYKGYLYDYESGMYYAKNECYSPTWCRNISTDGDYSKLQNISNNVLDNNLYLFCNNNLISNQDTYASWSTIRNDFNWFEDGFSVGMSKAFLSRPFCTLYAAQLIKENGNWNYQYGSNLYNMGVERISTNLFARALGHYSPNAINKVNANWGSGWLNNNAASDSVIYIRTNEENRVIKNYKDIWNAAPSIKNYAWSSGIFITV